MIALAVIALCAVGWLAGWLACGLLAALPQGWRLRGAQTYCGAGRSAMIVPTATAMLVNFCRQPASAGLRAAPL